MAFTIEFSERSIQDLDNIVHLIQADSPVNATRWRRKLEEKMRSLSDMPESHGFALENDRCDEAIRQLLHGRYRVLFTVRGSSVYVLTIRHTARKTMGESEIRSLIQGE